jgi:hypothetical protein
MELFEETSDSASHPYVRRLGEGAYAAEDTTIGQADLLTRVGLLVAEGMMITREARGAFLQTWPGVIQREIRPTYTGWSTTGEAASAELSSGKRCGEKVGLYDVEPAGETDTERRSISCLTLEAASVLGKATRIEWGLEGSTWYVLSIVTKDSENSTTLERRL